MTLSASAYNRVNADPKRSMKLVKTAPAVRSYALYGRGAKPAEWQVQTADGTVLFDVRGRRFDDGRRVYSLYVPGTKEPAKGTCRLTFAELRALVRESRTPQITGA